MLIYTNNYFIPIYTIHVHNAYTYTYTLTLLQLTYTFITTLHITFDGKIHINSIICSMLSITNTFLKYALLYELVYIRVSTLSILYICVTVIFTGRNNKLRVVMVVKIHLSQVVTDCTYSTSHLLCFAVLSISICLSHHIIVHLFYYLTKNGNG